MKIKLNDKVSIDLEKLVESRMLIQANSGGGKSHTIRRIIEQAFPHVQIIVIDPEGEFGNMRSKLDFVYVGKDGDAPAEPRSAELLARRLLELKASAIIDLYELSPQDRKHFVRLFCEALVNAPKNLWHDVLVIIDEAHVFAPEKDQSEALGAVIDLASRGRKRGYCAVLATQRAAKLNKDAAAECNNKLIGRASLDIDRKRSAEELGFSDKVSVLSLRDLNPGEFYAFGPAISRTVEKITIGDVQVAPAKRGASKLSVPAPTAKVKKILSQLADLPQEALQEAKTLSDAQTVITGLQRRLREVTKAPNPKPVIDQKAIEEAVRKAVARKDAAFQKLKETMMRFLMRTHKDADQLMKELMDDRREQLGVRGVRPDVIVIEEAGPVSPKQWEILGSRGTRAKSDGTGMGEGEKKVLIAIASVEEGITREMITLMTGYKRSTRDAYIQRLMQKDFATQGGDLIGATEEGVAALGSDYKPLPTGPELAQHYINTLPDGERKVFEILYNAGIAMSRDQISDETGYKRSTRDAYLQRLRVRMLVNLRGEGMVKASDHLYD